MLGLFVAFGLKPAVTFLDCCLKDGFDWQAIRCYIINEYYILIRFLLYLPIRVTGVSLALVLSGFSGFVPQFQKTFVCGNSRCERESDGLLVSLWMKYCI